MYLGIGWQLFSSTHRELSDGILSYFRWRRKLPFNSRKPENTKEMINIIIHQTHYEKSDWSRASNQFTFACELDMTKAISAADIEFMMSCPTSAWLLNPLECSPQKQNG